MSQHTNDSLSKAFAESLLSARGDRSQAEFARLLGIPSQQTYQRYENGLIPSGKVLHQIAARLGVTIDALLSEGTQAEAETAEKRVLTPAQTMPWGKELEEDTQMTVAIGLLCQRMTWQQLYEAMQDVIGHGSMPQKAKIFWMKILGEWALQKMDLAEFNKLSPQQKIAARRAQNYARRADPATKKATG